MNNSKSLKPTKSVLVAITSDIVTDMRVMKVVRFLRSQGYITEIICVKRSGLEWNNEVVALRMNMLIKRTALFYLFFNIRLFIHGLFRRTDIILSNDLDTLPAARLLGWIKAAPVVYDSHEFFTESVGLVDRRFVRKVWLTLEKNLVPGVAAAYTVSEPIAQAYYNRYGVQFSVIRNYPQLVDFPQSAESILLTDKKFILYQGVFNPCRSLPQLIESMQWIDDEYDLVLVGYGELENELRRLTKLFKVENRVIFVGRLKYDDMMQYTYKATLGIALEESCGLSFHYSLPNKVFDYVAAGLPFISLGTPLVKQLIDEHQIGIITESNSPSSLSEEINSILHDADRLQNIMSAQRDARSLFSWENELSKLSVLFPG